MLKRIYKLFSLNQALCDTLRYMFFARFRFAFVIGIVAFLTTGSEFSFGSTTSEIQGTTSSVSTPIASDTKLLLENLSIVLNGGYKTEWYSQDPWTSLTESQSNYFHTETSSIAKLAIEILGRDTWHYFIAALAQIIDPLEGVLHEELRRLQAISDTDVQNRTLQSLMSDIHNGVFFRRVFEKHVRTVKLAGQPDVDLRKMVDQIATENFKFSQIVAGNLNKTARPVQSSFQNAENSTSRYLSNTEHWFYAFIEAARMTAEAILDKRATQQYTKHNRLLREPTMSELETAFVKGAMIYALDFAGGIYSKRAEIAPEKFSGKSQSLLLKLEGTRQMFADIVAGTPLNLPPTIIKGRGYFSLDLPLYEIENLQSQLELRGDGIFSGPNARGFLRIFGLRDHLSTDNLTLHRAAFWSSLINNVTYEKRTLRAFSRIESYFKDASRNFSLQDITYIAIDAMFDIAKEFQLSKDSGVRNASLAESKILLKRMDRLSSKLKDLIQVFSTAFKANLSIAHGAGLQNPVQNHGQIVLAEAIKFLGALVAAEESWYQLVIDHLDNDAYGLEKRTFQDESALAKIGFNLTWNSNYIDEAPPAALLRLDEGKYFGETIRIGFKFAEEIFSTIENIKASGFSVQIKENALQLKEAEIFPRIQVLEHTLKFINCTDVTTL